ncbi:hypothetical protein ILUMI_25823 [Ignelater luminosus]|uniref:Uncharacterized protein n=1 Tax=Ignelater luminosus TaxID=2038154 RepID=A0A8K0FZJ4_IGNLU|nr:hypothetical protein ILUMI_25823 [Ignelater luminosus]
MTPCSQSDNSQYAIMGTLQNDEYRISTQSSTTNNETIDSLPGCSFWPDNQHSHHFPIVRNNSSYINFERSPWKNQIYFQTLEMIEEQNEELLLNEGINCILTIYDAKTVKNLNELRYKRFIALASKNKNVQLNLLPQTEDAVKQHIKRVYLQVQQWKDNALIPPEEWGWQKDNYLNQSK